MDNFSPITVINDSDRKNLVLAEGGRKHTTTTFQSAASVHIPWVGSRSSDSGK